MNLEQVSAVLRPRRGFEAADLGLALLRRWFGAVLAAWAVAVLPVCVLVMFLLDLELWAALLLLWWLTPLFERVPLYVLSRALFGDVPTLQSTLAELPRIYGRQWWLALSWHRLTSARAMLQPIVLLENASGWTRAKRESTLLNEGRSTAILLAFVHLFLVWALALQIVVTVWFFTPSELRPDPSVLFEPGEQPFDPMWLETALRAAWIAAYSLAAPMNAATGFALYINRRMQLEGWDIEIVFRRLAQRARSLVRGAATVLIVALACAPLASAQEVAADPGEVARRILATPEFETMETRSELHLRFALDSSREGAADLAFLAVILQVLGWVLLLVLLVAVVVTLLRAIGWIQWKKPAEERAQAPPTHLFGLDLRPESLPDDIGAEALALWRRGEAVGALGLLYRAAISRLIERGLELDKSDTESDCLRRVRALPDVGRSAYFGAVTRAWLLCAYSPLRPADGEVEALCTGWMRFEQGNA
jgi:hypothetical protein